MLPGLGMIESIATASRHAWPKHLVSDDDLLFGVARAGQSQFAGSGREAIVGVGEAVLMGGGESGHKDSHADGHFIYLQVPKRAIAGAVADLDNLICRRITAETPALRLLRHYLGILDDTDVLATRDLQRQIVSHIHDLVVLTLGATREAADAAKTRGARAARLQAIRSDVIDNLAREDLTVAALAARHRLPVRYVQRLFEEQGVTFTEFLLGERLAHAYRLLTNSRFANLKISAVAIDAGFGNISYFNQSFRRRYGVSPSDMRTQGRRDH